MRKHILALLLQGITSFSAIRAHSQVVLIANPDLKIETISAEDLRNIFTGASQNLRNGPHVNPVLLTRSAIHDEFLLTYIGEKAIDFRADWMSLLFAGKLRLPPTLASDAEVADYVSSHPFTIGYIRKSTRHSGVTVLTVK